MAPANSTVYLPGVTQREHEITVPIDRADPARGEITVFARELYTDASLPYLVYFQGGPGKPGPRMLMDWIPEALKRYRVLLIDERGTGRSTKIDRTTPERIDAHFLAHLRPPDVAADAEAMREYLGVEQWDLLGNSFGAACAGSYLSYFPSGLRRVHLVGAVPEPEMDVDAFNRLTFALLRARQEELFAAVPWIKARVEEVADHLENHDVRMPTGERLSSTRFRMVGVLLGEEGDFGALATLMEMPFTTYRGEKRLRGDFLAQVGSIISLETMPLWAVVHESVMARPGHPTRWSAERIYREEFADLTLLGNHFFATHFEEDPALKPFYGAVDEVQHMDTLTAQARDLSGNEVPTAALLFKPDLFIPYELTADSASRIGNLKLWSHDEWFHDGIWVHGREVAKGLFEMLD
ncbi:alpha/beta fold hydrolase [Corynebacterium sp. CNCTC7651]|uniref:alpha/beta fold hydrolase n=2 Tax=Corynebacterium TaxID=1716 RepID=UPI001F27F0B8|nr:alpha/beta fold hydrolase [Corynebacterium sp. CNCTC7651]UIZ91726.1 alpha/beta fold hydrolase [Corynebacterium sp. CNCTC7651]